VNAFLRKLKLSFLAMLCGWIACNITLWVGFLAVTPDSRLRFDTICITASSTGFGTALVLLTSWLFVFLPADLSVPNLSNLRQPIAASICGFISGSCVAAILWKWSSWHYGRELSDTFENFAWDRLHYWLSPGITGMVAAYIRARLENPKPPMAP
jgi:hypothetical protein